MMAKAQIQPMVVGGRLVIVLPIRPTMEATVTIQAPIVAIGGVLNILLIHHISPEEAELLFGDIEDRSQENDADETGEGIIECDDFSQDSVGNDPQGIYPYADDDSAGSAGDEGNKYIINPASPAP